MDGLLLRAAYNRARTHTRVVYIYMYVCIYTYMYMHIREGLSPVLGKHTRAALSDLFVLLHATYNARSRRRRRCRRSGARIKRLYLVRGLVSPLYTHGATVVCDVCGCVCVCVEEAVCAERFASLRAVFGARALFECLPRELGMRARSRNCQVEMYIWAASRPPLWGPLAGRRKYICLMCVALVLLAMIRLWFRSSDDNLSSEWMSESQTLVRSW